MAKLECALCGDFDAILNDLTNTVMDGSATATLEEESDFCDGNCRLAVRAFERYSYFGGNRVSLTIVLLKNQDTIFLTAIATGGSQAVFFKMNTVGEDGFLDTVIETVEKYKA